MTIRIGHVAGVSAPRRGNWPLHDSGTGIDELGEGSIDVGRRRFVVRECESRAAGERRSVELCIVGQIVSPEQSEDHTLEMKEHDFGAGSPVGCRPAQGFVELP